MNKYLRCASVIPLLALLVVPVAAHADDMADMKRMLRELQQQVTELKQENVAARREIAAIKAKPAESQHVAHKQAAAPMPIAVPVGPIPVIPPQGDPGTPTKIASAPVPAGQTVEIEQPVTYNPKTGFIHLPGTDTKFKVGGYAKLDTIYDIGSERTGNSQDFLQPANAPLKGTPEQRADGNFRMHVRQSRLNATTLTPTEWGDLKFFVETDLYGPVGNETIVNNHSFGLRHLYGQLGPVLVGQTWSNFMDPDSIPETLDFVGPAGMTLIRQAQVRYTQPLGKGSLAASLETPSNDVTRDYITPPAGQVLKQAPDATVKYTYGGDWGFVSAKGLGRQIDSKTPAGDDSDFGYGVGVAGRYNIGKRDNIRGQIDYGRGIGRYIFDVASSPVINGGNASATSPGLRLAPVAAGYAGYQHGWTDTVRSNLIYGHTEIDNSGGGAAFNTLNKSIDSVETNLIWQPLKSLQFGASYMYGHRETEGGQEGDVNRIMASSWLFF